MGKTVAIKAPKKLFKRNHGRAVTNLLNSMALGAQKDMKVTTYTWSNKPRFNKVRRGRFEVVVGTNSKIYRYVDAGTRAHDIRPKRSKVLSFRAGYRAKTRVGSMDSFSGGSYGASVRARVVRHPGTKPRKFVKKIGKKWNRLAPKLANRMIEAELNR